MSVTQVAFAFFLLMVAPGFGVSGALRCRGTKLRWLWGFAAGTGAAWFGLAVSGVVAAFSHPRYPLEGPPEQVALLYVIPGFLFGIAAVLLLDRYAPQAENRDAGTKHQRRAKRLLIVGAVLSALAIFGLYSLFVSPLHSALPWSARHVRQYYWSDGFLPDYSYCLKARIPAEEYPDYLKRAGLTRLHTEDRVYEDDKVWLRWAKPKHEANADWWDPPPVESGKTYVDQGGDEWVLADYRDGWLYVSGLNH